MTDAERIGQTLDAIRQRWRRRTALEGLVPWLATGVGLLMLWWLVWPLVSERALLVTVARTVIVATLVAVAGWRWLVWQRRRPDRAAVALYVEEHEPALRQSLVSSVEAMADPAAPAGLTARILESAECGLVAINGGRAIESRRLRRASARLGGLVLGTAALLVAGPAHWRTATVTLVTPWRPVPVKPSFLVQVTPGNAEVPKGGGVDVAATLNGFSSELADVVFRADTTGDWTRLPMRRDTALGTFASRLFDVAAPTEYYVESNGIRSPAFKLTPVDLPAVGRTAATIQYPAYTALPAETIGDAGDLAVLAGSTVALAAAVTRPAKAASLVVEGRSPVPMKLGADGRWTAAFKVTADAFWRIDLDTDDGRRITGLQYAVDALADAPPRVHFAAPGRDTKASPIEEVTAQTEASDDYGVRKLALHVTVNGGADSAVTLADTAVKALKDLAAAHTFFLEEWSLKPGDLVAYYAEATDGAGQTAKSDIYFLEIRPFDKTYREAEQGNGAPMPGGGDSAEGLSERQRQVVVGSFNTIRDSTVQAKDFRENVTTLAISEGRLRQDVTGLSQRLRARQMTAVDSTFTIIAASLDTAGTELAKAEEQLGRVKPREALAPAQRALTQLQRAEAAYRETQVARGNQQGGGAAGGKQPNAEELADLFELETDKLKNQYESVQRENAQQAERQLDETVERLKKLATRQEQENERAQRMADALRNKSTPSGGGGGAAGAQRQLAQETEETARQLERLAREKNDQTLADAARRLRAAAEQMRKAAAANPGQAGAQGGSALEQLKNATRGIDRSRAQSRQEEIKSLGDRGRDIRQRQQEAADQANSLPADPTARAERLKALESRKDALARDVERLEADAERLSKDAARDQPAAARKLGEAAEGLRANRVRDKLVFSKQLAQRGSPDYIRSFEEQIGKNLDEAVERLGAAGGAVESSVGDRKAEALDRARSLVRGLESLTERARAAQQNQGRRNGLGERRERDQTGPEGRPDRQGQPGQQGKEGQPGQPGREGQPGQPAEGGKGGQQPGQGTRPTGEPGQMPANSNAPDGRLDRDASRQFAREFRARRQAAESLRADLRAMGQDTQDLDRLLARFRTFDTPKTFDEPKGLDGLERDLIAGLKEMEFALWRRFGDDGAGDRPAAGASAQVPPQYRELVAEYYRSLAKKRPKA